jgi:two-component system cell cycle sensor histidine kinase PleC
MLKTVLIVTLLFVAVSFGLIAWNFQHARDSDELKLLQRDAVIAGQQLNAAADSTQRSLDGALAAGTDLARINASQIGVERLIRLQAVRAPDSSAVQSLMVQARQMAEAGHRLALGENDQLLVILSVAGAPAAIALVQPKEWLPDLPMVQRVILRGDTSIAVGGAHIVAPGADTLRSGQGFRYTQTLDRSATACSAVRGASFALCINRASPLLTLENAVQLLLYLLLLAAPSLAVFGLYSSLSGKPGASELAPSKREGPSLPSRANTAGRVGTWEVTLHDEVATVDEEAARLLGFQFGGEISLTDLLDKINDGHRDRLRSAMEGANSTRPFSIGVGTAMSRGETWMEFRGSQHYESGGGQARLSGVVFDITETVRQRERQKASEARLKRALENFPSPFALWDHKKRLIFWNKTFEQVFSLEDVLRVGVGHETVMLARSANVVTEKATADDANMSMVGLRSGEWFKIAERRTPANGLITFGLNVTRDVEAEEELTRQKKKLRNAVQELGRSEGHNAELARKYNEEKAKAERSADSKSAFLANMSHELRTPLNAINGFSEILVNEMYGPLGDRRYGEYAQDILTSGQHLLDMINDILDIAKIEAGKMTIDPKPIDLVDPVDAAVRMIRRKAEEKNIQLSLQAEDRLPEVDADHRAVRQMVLNLLSNAIKFTDADGRIVVAVQQKNDFVRVAVRDSGVGIPQEDLPRLAQPFEQVQETRERNYDGTGLGLALTKSFAEMHGGRFSIASEVGKGTMVSFYLPVSKDLSRSDRYVA